MNNTPIYFHYPICSSLVYVLRIILDKKQLMKHSHINSQTKVQVGTHKYWTGAAIQYVFLYKKEVIPFQCLLNVFYKAYHQIGLK